MIQIGVLAGARREALTAETLANIDWKGGASAFNFPRTLFYSAPASFRAPTLPSAAWKIIRRLGPNGAGADFGWMIDQLDPNLDALLFEDDVYPITNAIVEMSRTEVPDGYAFVSFYDFRNLTDGKAVAVDSTNATYWGMQAVRLPAWLIWRMQQRDFGPVQGPQDAWMGIIAAKLGMPILQTPSLVQHIGRVSLHCPGADLVGDREPSHSFPESFELSSAEPPFCTFHGCVHPNSTACPILGE